MNRMHLKAEGQAFGTLASAARTANLGLWRTAYPAHTHRAVFS